MTEAQVGLAKRAVACKGWRWMPGMLTTQGERVVGESREAWGTRLWVSLLGADSAGGVFVRSFCDSSGSCLPDLTDPATRGSLLALVREAWGDSEMHMALGAKGWVWLTGESRVYDVVIPINAGETEDEALVAALEAAP
jgi:hypothetical protein